MKDTKLVELVNRITGANKGLAKRVTKDDLDAIRSDLANDENKVAK